MKEYKIVVSRGRWKEDRWVQQYECNQEDVTNTLTGVQKDNLVIEIEDENGQDNNCRELYATEGQVEETSTRNGI